jgi:hypothetical protein
VATARPTPFLLYFLAIKKLTDGKNISGIGLCIFYQYKSNVIIIALYQVWIPVVRVVPILFQVWIFGK